MIGLSETAVREMIERVTELSRSFSVWWTLVNKSNFARYSSAINDHLDFFETTSHSLFQGFSVLAYQLFELRHDTNSISGLVKSLGPSHAALKQKLSDEIAAKRPLLGKVFTIRNNIYAHRNSRQPPEDFFSAVGLSANEMREIVLFAQDVVSTLAEVAGIDTKSELEAEFKNREMFACEDTRFILEALNSNAL